MYSTEANPPGSLLIFLLSLLPAIELDSAYSIKCILVLSAALCAQQPERARLSACIHLHRALWRLKFRLNRSFSPLFSSSCALLVYDKSVALIPGVGRQR